MLILTKLIGMGAVRECYEHPDDKRKCVKVLLPKADPSVFEREFRNYLAVKDVLKDYIIPCEPVLIETNKGPGMICDKLTDDDGSKSKMIWEYRGDDEVRDLLDAFVRCILENNVFLYDFNVSNVAIQIVNGEKKLKFIDLKSFRHNKTWCFLKLENVFDCLARIIMVRRLKRLYWEMGFKRPPFL